MTATSVSLPSNIGRALGVTVAESSSQLDLFIKRPGLLRLRRPPANQGLFDTRS